MTCSLTASYPQWGYHDIRRDCRETEKYKFAEPKPMAEYLIQCDDGFLVGSFRRHRALHPSRMAFNVVKVCAAVLLAVACLSSAAQGWIGMALLWASLIAVLVMSHRIDYWLMCRRFRRSPYRGETVRTAVDPEGVHSVAGTHDVSRAHVQSRGLGEPTDAADSQ